MDPQRPVSATAAADVMKARTDRPLLVFGTGRCGTSMFLRLLAAHPDLGWFSTYVERLPRVPQLAALSRMWDIPGARPILDPLGRVPPRPAEVISTVGRITDGRFQSPHTLEATSADDGSAERYHRAVATTLRWQGKTRYVQKHTGFPRLHYLRAIFPDARFIHVVRYGRAVVNSLLGMDWWSGTLDGWWWGPMPEAYRDEFEASGRNPVVLGAIQWKFLIDLAERQIDEIGGDDVMTVDYSRLADDHVSVMEEVRRFGQLEASDRFTRRVSRTPIHDGDRAWRSALSAGDRAALDRSLGEHLARYGYS